MKTSTSHNPIKHSRPYHHLQNDPLLSPQQTIPQPNSSNRHYNQQPSNPYRCSQAFQQCPSETEPQSMSEISNTHRDEDLQLLVRAHQKIRTLEEENFNYQNQIKMLSEEIVSLKKQLNDQTHRNKLSKRINDELVENVMKLEKELESKNYEGGNCQGVSEGQQEQKEDEKPTFNKSRRHSRNNSEYMGAEETVQKAFIDNCKEAFERQMEILRESRRHLTKGKSHHNLTYQGSQVPQSIEENPYTFGMNRQPSPSVTHPHNNIQHQFKNPKPKASLHIIQNSSNHNSAAFLKTAYDQVEDCERTMKSRSSLIKKNIPASPSSQYAPTNEYSNMGLSSNTNSNCIAFKDSTNVNKHHCMTPKPNPLSYFTNSNSKNLLLKDSKKSSVNQIMKKGYKSTHEKPFQLKLNSFASNSSVNNRSHQKFVNNENGYGHEGVVNEFKGKGTATMENYQQKCDYEKLDRNSRKKVFLEIENDTYGMRYRNSHI